jgi:hypothetical protein
LLKGQPDPDDIKLKVRRCAHHRIDERRSHGINAQDLLI